MEILAIIPARSGSRGLPQKNLKKLSGKPLIEYTIRAAKNSKLVNRTIVTTDDKKIAVFKISSETVVSRSTFPQVKFTLFDTKLIQNIILNFLFKNSNFSSVLVAIDPSVDMDLVCAVAEKFQVKTFSIPSTPIISSLSFFADMFNAEKIFVEGEMTKKEIDNYLHKDRSMIVGNPRYDYTFSRKQKNKKKSKTIIISMSRWHTNDEKWISDIIHFCNKNHFEIILKPHPVYHKAFRSIHEEKISDIRKKCSRLKYKILENTDSKVIANADLIITERSTIGIEASLNNIPLLLIKVDNRNEDPLGYNFVNEKVAVQVSDSKELQVQIKKMLFDNSLQQKLEKYRKKFNYKINYLNDGKASDRIHDIMTNRNSRINKI